MHPRPEWLLFDDRGAAWAAPSIDVWRKPSCPGRCGDPVADPIRDLGFVGGRRLGDSAALRLHRRAVSEIALVAAFYWLADRDPQRVLIDFVGESRPAEVCTSAAAAIGRLIRLTQQHGPSRSTEPAADRRFLDRRSRAGK